MGSTGANVYDVVLIFLFAHLMNSSLGLASLEEACAAHWWNPLPQPFA